MTSLVSGYKQGRRLPLQTADSESGPRRSSTMLSEHVQVPAPGMASSYSAGVTGCRIDRGGGRTYACLIGAVLENGGAR